MNQQNAADAYRELAQKTHQMRVVLDAIKGGIKISRDDDTFSYAYVSEELCRLFGYTHAEFMEMSGGSAVGACYPPDIGAALAKVAEDFADGGRDYAAKYRIRCKDGSLKWILDSGNKTTGADGETIINSLYLDVTEMEEAYQALARQRDLLEKERQRFRIAIENTQVIVFEYEVDTDLYSAFGTLEQASAKHNVERQLPRFLADCLARAVDPRSLPEAVALFTGERDNVELRMRAYFGSDQFVWARATATPVCEDGQVRKYIGKITSIETEKEKEFALEAARARDSLTRLYNREAGIRLVKEYMEQKSPDQVCAMMLLDMDNFTRINEQEGSVFADAVLQEVAEVLRTQTGVADIQIRLGGDEFMLFIKDCDKARAAIVGPCIARTVHELFGLAGTDREISVSIGMCVTAVVDEYGGLYRCAESTLKYVKENCRGTAACFLDSSSEIGEMLTQVYTEAHFINAIDRMSSYGEEDLVSFALELLGKSNNLDDAVFLLLARVGRSLELSRVSIMEVDADYLSCRFAFQWAQNNADLHMNETHYMSREELQEIMGGYDQDGVSCTCNFQGFSCMESCMHAAIWDRGAYTGAMSFESQQPDREWTHEQRKLLRELVKIVSSFLMKARADAGSKAKSDFLSRMSHEIRTPMNAISGMTTIAKTVVSDPEKTLDCLNKIETANTYLLGLINDVLDMARIESGRVELCPENVDLSGLLQKLEALLRPQAQKKQISLQVENAYAGGRVIADPLKLNQVLVNIIGNAIKFTGENGIVRLLVEESDAGAGKTQLRFAVQDNGIGISREALGRIFNAFEQAGQNRLLEAGGTGLGLSISSRLVQMMGGLLEVHSEPGRGSEFYFSLTLDRAPALSAPETQAAAAPAPGFDFTGLRLLVAEDNPLNREIAETILTMNGFVVESVADGKQACDHFAARTPGYYDAILMDIRMPVLDGLAATKRIRTLGKADSRSVPIIAMTANAFDEDSKKSIESGMNGHLSKPLDLPLLLATLQSCLQNEVRGNAAF